MKWHTAGDNMRKKLLALLIGGLSSLTVQATPTDDIRTLLEAGRFGDAYRLGSQNADELGNPEFDFFYGIAALDGGNPGEGVLALERCLLAFPDNRSARFHLARGYYILGEDQRARSEFSALIGKADPTERVGIERFLDAIRARESRYRPTFSFFTEVGMGYDSNVNVGASTGSVAGLPGFTVNPAGTSAREADSFVSFAAGAQGSHPIAPGMVLYGGLQGNSRWHGAKQNDIFDQYGGLAQGGITSIDGRNIYRAGIEYNQLAIDDQNYLQAASILGEWGRQLDQFNRLGLHLQYSQLRYEDIPVFLDKQKTLSFPSGASYRDSNLTLISLSWSHAFVHPWNPVTNIFVSFGEERNTRARSEFSRDMLGARAILNIQPSDAWRLSVALAYQNSQYRDFFSGVASYPKRQDHYTSLVIGATYVIDRNYSISAEATKADQHSNIGLYDYGRDIVAIKMRYDY